MHEADVCVQTHTHVPYIPPPNLLEFQLKVETLFECRMDISFPSPFVQLGLYCELTIFGSLKLFVDLKIHAY